MPKTLDWNRAKLKEFEEVYKDSLDNRGSTFMFEDNEFYIGYAKYLIEHLKNEFDRHKIEEDD